MNWWLLGGLYAALLIFLCLRILYDIDSTSKAFAYLLVVLLIPGVVSSFISRSALIMSRISFTVKKIIFDNKLLAEIREKVIHQSEKTWENGEE